MLGKGSKVDPREVEPDELAHAQAGAVQQLEHGPVAHAQRIVGAGAVGHLDHFAGVDHR